MNLNAHIVVVEDCVDDYQIIRHELEKGNFSFDVVRIDNEKEFIAHLSNSKADVVLSDFCLPQFSARRALELTRRLSPATPFILVSGAVGEEAAVEMLKAGCVDYVMKDKLARLPSAVQRAIREADLEREKHATYDTLKENVLRFRRLADNSPSLIWMSNVKNECTFVSRGWLEFTGSVLEDVLGDRWTKYIHPDDTEYVLKTLNEAKQEHRQFEIEYRMRRCDGTYRWMIDRGTPNFLTDEQYFGYIGSCLDITDRKQMEQSLRQTTELLDTFFSQSLDGCYFFLLKEPVEWKEETDKKQVLAEIFETGIVSRANNSFAEQYKIPGERVNGMTPAQFFGNQFEKGCQLLLNLFNSGAAQYSTTVMRSDSTEIVVEGNAVCLYDERRKIAGFFGIQRDVTQSAKEREELERNKDRFKKFFEDDLNGDFITKPDGTLLLCNEAFVKIFKFSSREEAMRTNVKTLYVNLEDRSTMWNIVHKENKIETYKVLLRKIDGTEFKASLTAIGNFSRSGELLEIVGYLTDDSRREEMEIQMMQAQKLESIGTLAGGVAHDFNNILNNIYGFSQQLVKYHTDSARVLRYAETISKSAQRGTDIASKLLSFARRHKTEAAIVAVEDVVAEVAQMCRDTFMHTVHVHTDVEPGLWKVHGDKSGLYQMLLNLSVNSKDAILERKDSGTAGTLHLSAKNTLITNNNLHWFRNTPPTHAVEICIKDNGIGIGEGTLTKIFDPFFTTKKDGAQKGTGLGLTVVYNIVKNHHGAIDVQSQPGAGTQFHVYLPAVEYSQAILAKNNLAQYRSRFKELVLVVDDEEVMQQLARELLEESGYRVITAANGLEAISLYEQMKDDISLVVLDLVMPELDGGQTYIRLKKIDPKIKVFFCSGYVTEDLITTLLEEEELRSLQKPFRAEQFIKFVHDTLYQ